MEDLVGGRDRRWKCVRNHVGKDCISNLRISVQTSIEDVSSESVDWILSLNTELPLKASQLGDPMLRVSTPILSGILLFHTETARGCDPVEPHVSGGKIPSLNFDYKLYPRFQGTDESFAADI